MLGKRCAFILRHSLAAATVAAMRGFGRRGAERNRALRVPDRQRSIERLVAGAGGRLLRHDADGRPGLRHIFRLVPPGSRGGWQQRVLANLTKTDGNAPYSGVVAGPNGDLYGAASGGDPGGSGTVFRLAPPSKNRFFWTTTVLHDFVNRKTDGQGPIGDPLVRDASGDLYGTTTSGGGCPFCGTVYRLAPSPDGKTWTETLLHRFGVGNDGAVPSPASPERRQRRSSERRTKAAARANSERSSRSSQARTGPGPKA